MKYIFLDIDGVMLPFGVSEFPKEQMDNLQKIIDNVEDVAIVISSDWRFSHDRAQLADLFPKEIGSRIIDVTGVAETRDKEIAQWINAKDVDPEDCVALEDHHEITCIPMVDCNPLAGLTEEDAYEAYEYLIGARQFYDVNADITELPDF